MNIYYTCYISKATKVVTETHVLILYNEMHTHNSEYLLLVNIVVKNTITYFFFSCRRREQLFDTLSK